MTDRNNKQERVWNDPPMPGEVQPQKTPDSITLSAGVPLEIRNALGILDVYYRRVRLLTTIFTALTFTIAYAILIRIPEITNTDIQNFFILATILTVITEIARYYKAI